MRNPKIINTGSISHTLFSEKSAFEAYNSFLSHDIFFLQIFDGNTDNTNAVVNTLLSPVDAIFVKILPVTWEGQIGLRFDIRGCSKCKSSLKVL